MSTNGLETTEDSLVKYRIDNRTLLVFWENPLSNAVWGLLQVSRKSSKCANLRGILGRSEDHMGKGGEVIIWVSTKRRL